MTPKTKRHRVFLTFSAPAGQEWILLGPGCDTGFRQFVPVNHASTQLVLHDTCAPARHGLLG